MKRLPQIISQTKKVVIKQAKNVQQPKPKTQQPKLKTNCCYYKPWYSCKFIG